MSESHTVQESSSVWAPLRRTVFRYRLLASIVSNTGNWMQDTAGTWLMATLTTSPLMIALMQTAAALPVLLFGVPAGAMADILDRRRLLMFWAAWMLVAAGLMSALTLSGGIGAWWLLALTFLLSLGAAMNGPTWQAIVPELVPREELPNAIALNSAAFNIARAVGPAMGGLLVAAFASAMLGAGLVFFFNSLAFVAVLVVIYRWKRKPFYTSALPAERLVGSMRAGLRYVRFAPPLRSILTRSFLQTFCVSAMWALLAVVAQRNLRHGAIGYGILMASIGVGAVLGAMLLPRMRRLLSADQLVMGAAVIFAGTLLVMAWGRHLWLLIFVLVLGGFGWTTTASCLNIAVQLSVPAWVQARALGVYQTVFLGGLALGSAVWGAVAEHVGLNIALSAAAAGLILSLPLARRFPLMAAAGLDHSPGRLVNSLRRSVPQIVIEPCPEEGPVLVTVTFRIDPARAEEFVRTAHELGAVRRRDGAIRWALFRDPFDPARYVETYVLESWLERERQIERFTVADRSVHNRVFAFHLGPEAPEVSRLTLAELPCGQGSVDPTGPVPA